jgi:SRSO17 transposase
MPVRPTKIHGTISAFTPPVSSPHSREKTVKPSPYKPTPPSDPSSGFSLNKNGITKKCATNSKKSSPKGIMIWEVKECTIYIRSERGGVPFCKPMRLIVARNAMSDEEKKIKYFVSNAPADVPLDNLLLAGFSCWRVERSFQDTKQKLGLGDYEGRCYTGLIRHLLLCSLAYYFLQCQWCALSKKTKS